MQLALTWFVVPFDVIAYLTPASVVNISGAAFALAVVRRIGAETTVLMKEDRDIELALSDATRTEGDAWESDGTDKGRRRALPNSRSPKITVANRKRVMI